MKIQSFEDMLQAQLTISLAGQKLKVSIFMIDGLLIDTGPTTKRADLIRLLTDWKFTEVILTHHHEDHTGLAHWIQQHKKTPIYIHEYGVGDCEKNGKIPLYRRAFWGSRKAFQPQTLPHLFKTKQYTWDIIHTPGHAHDHVALYNREKRWMFGGDLYVQGTPKSMFSFESAPMIIRSLKEILTYDFDTYICSHVGIMHNGRDRIEKKVEYLENLQGKVLDLRAQGLSAKEIRKQLFPNKHLMQYLSLFENSPQHLIDSMMKK
ncbi:MAG TPA: MBL fold metallo-hydrolase [Virgibacillus sp.]|nr:MBL fold metallo-hydrolase [Virgibacillus sp.]